LAILLKRVGVSSSNGVGYANAGFGADAQQVNFTLDDQAAQDVHFYQAGSFALNANGQLTGTWQPDGRVLAPSSSSGAFDLALRSSKLNSFNGLDPNGQWTLFVADVSPGNAGSIVGWGLDIATVPEPSATVLGLLGGRRSSADTGERRPTLKTRETSP
jgi:hypothetical protein